MSVTFRIKASEAHGRRLDPSFYSPQYKQLDEALASCCYDCYEIRDLRIEVFQGVSRNLLENDRIRLLKVKNILPDGSIDFGDTEPISDVSVNKILKDGDIISPFIGAASGSKEHAGKVAYVRNAPDDTYIGGFMMVLRTDAGVNPEYVAAYMQSSIFRGLIFRHLGGTNINNVSLELLNKLPLIMPDAAIQDGIAIKASSIRAEACKLKADATAALDAAKRKIEMKIIEK